MRKLVRIIYTVQYAKLVNIEVSKDLEQYIFMSGSPNVSDDPDMIDEILAENEDILRNLPIPAPKACLVHDHDPVIQEIHFDIKEL